METKSLVGLILHVSNQNEKMGIKAVVVVRLTQFDRHHMVVVGRIKVREKVNESTRKLEA